MAKKSAPRRAKTAPKPRRETRRSQSRQLSSPALSRSVPDEEGAGHKPAARFPIVGVGASAGGLDAFTALLAALPPETGMAFVLIQHMDPKHESVLASLLQKATSMPVREVTHGLAVQPDHVYVIPPNRLMTISNRVLALTPRKQGPVRNLPIDHFFAALADDLESASIGVVLSGTGSDGTAGLKAIKAQGGITFAQDKESAQYGDMPLSAVAAGCVDFVLPPRRIAAELARIMGHPYLHSVPAGDATSLAEGSEDGLRKICTLLRSATGVDFGLYKRPTISRRIARRMAVRQMDSLEEYAQLLMKDRNELKSLYDDIFIHVTGFFRDPESLQALQDSVFARILSDERPQVRVWVPGCSSGEEVYSIAMLLAEQLGERRSRAAIQIFGTDISERAIEQARSGIYLEAGMADVAEERQLRFFGRVEGGFQVLKSLRDLCVFARHDLAKDPPFSRLDLISCRNVLIYMGSTLQRKVIETFHYALKPGGCLFVGRSESLSAYSNLFSLEDSKHKIFSRQPFTAPLRLRIAAAVHADPESAPAVSGPVAPVFDVRHEVERALLDQYSPAALVIDTEFRIIQFHGNTGPFLAPASGEPSFHLLRMVRPELIVDLRTAVHQVKKEGVAVRKEGIPFQQQGEYVSVDIQISPLKGRTGGEADLLVVFETKAMPKPADVRKPGRPDKEITAQVQAEIASRDREVASLREQLQAMVQDHEAAREEMRAMNEEVLSSNEELQSTNEELETAKEELQSSNEELTTLNDELQKRNSELAQLTDDLSNLLTGVEIPILFAGADLRVRRFTPLAGKVLNLIATDVGRPLTDIASTLQDVDWRELASQVIGKSQIVERDVRDRDGHWYALRMRPYRTGERAIDGILMALLDIDVVKRSLDAAQEARDFADAIVETIREPLLVLDAEFRVVRATQSFCSMFQVSKQDTDGQLLFTLGNGQWDLPGLREVLTQVLPRDTAFDNFPVDHDFPSIGRKSMLLNGRQIQPRSGSPPLILLAIEDVTHQKQADRAKLAAAQEETARRIARELHDDLVQQLASLAIEIGSYVATPPRSSQLQKKELRSLQARVVRAAETARHVAYKLHPTELDDLGLETALRLHSEEFGQREGIDVAFQSRNLPPGIDRDIAHCLYKVAQESLRNVVKHAGAKRAAVSIESTADEVRLTVEDFGAGFSVSLLETTAGLGVMSMQERVQLAKGRFSIASEPGKGTRITVEVPLPGE